MKTIEFAMKLLEATNADAQHLPIRFSADNPYDSSAEIVEFEFSAFNIEKEYVEIELKRFDPHKELIEYFERAISRLYFPQAAATLKVLWDEDDQCYILSLRESVPGQPHTPQWVSSKNDLYSYYVWTRVDTIGNSPISFTVPDPNASDWKI